MGANIGTTVTAWIISALGFKVDIAAMALPLLPWQGGNMRNAIPRECEVVITVPAEEEADVLEFVQECEEMCIRDRCEARSSWKESMSRRDAISLRMALTILKLVMGRDGGIIIPQKIW